MKKKLQVFVSSTYNDLKEERQAAVEGILDAGHIPAGMELFKGGKSQMKTIQKWIDESDVYMLILGGRYGTIERESGSSYTELEYRYALSKNMPVFAVILSEEFLTNKINNIGLLKVTEQDAPDKYRNFKSFVMTKIIKEVNDCKDIKLTISNTLNELINENELVGWIRANSDAYTFKHFSVDKLNKMQSDILNTLFLKSYPNITDKYMEDFSGVLSKNIFNFIKSPYGILRSSERQIRISFANKQYNILKVTITKILDYFYVEPNKHSFFVNFKATKRQATTYKKISLTIDGEDFTKQLNIAQKNNYHHEQFPYNVTSNKLILKNPQSKIVYVCSYECHANEFFQSHRLNCLCKNFKANITLNDDVKQKYRLICSTFSPFSKIHYDDVKAGEMFAPYDQQINLPDWSLPGSGYIATLEYIPSKSKL